MTRRHASSAPVHLRGVLWYYKGEELDDHSQHHLPHLAWVGLPDVQHNVSPCHDVLPLHAVFGILHHLVQHL